MFSSSLHVCFDARKITHGGIGVYIQNTLLGLERLGVKLTLLFNEVPPQNIKLPENAEQVFVKAKPSTMEDIFLLAREVNWEGIDLFHSPNYPLPFGIPCKTVLTVHDLIHLRHPERSFYPFVSAPLLFSSLFRADNVVTVSRATYGELKSFTKFLPKLMKKVSVIPNALAESFSQQKKIPEFVKNRFSIKSPYFLSVLSTVKPHKGVKDLLDAFLDLESRGVLKGHKDIKLVLVGQGTQSLLQVERLLKKADSLRCVRLLGAVSKDEIYHLYANAKALIVPSYREGFCLPVIEAQSVNTPVVTRPIPAVLDHLSPLDVVSDDFSTTSLVHAIENLLERDEESLPDPSTVAKWRSAFDKKFCPYEIGEKLLKVYGEASGEELSPAPQILDEPMYKERA